LRFGENLRVKKRKAHAMSLSGKAVLQEITAETDSENQISVKRVFKTNQTQ